MNSKEQKTILLLNVSPSDTGSISVLIGNDANFVTAYNVDDAIKLMQDISVDLILTDSSKRSALLLRISSDEVFANIPVLSVERSFKENNTINLLDKETEEHLLKNISQTMDELEKSRYYQRFAYEALPASIIIYYLDWRPMPYISGNLFTLFGYSSEEILQMQQKGLAGLVNEDDLARANRALAEADAGNKDRIINEYHMYKKDGSVAYVQEIATRFHDEDGSVGFISVFTDVTERYEMLESLRLSEKIMRTVCEHSERIIYFYDTALDELRAVNNALAMKFGLADFCVDPQNILNELGLIHSDSVDSLNKLFDDIRSGSEGGSIKLHMTCLDGSDRWFDLCYTAMKTDCSKNLGAIISMLDVTLQHDHEISHARYQQNIESVNLDEAVFFEFDLTDNIVEKQTGSVNPFNENYLNKPYTDTVAYMTKNIGSRREQRRIRTYLATDKLLSAYDSTQRRISDDWKITLEDGSYIWLHCSVQLVVDPYTDHIKMYMSLRDVTDNKLKQLNILHQAENDGLTGLYNRKTIESKITDSLAKDYKDSVFILIDLDGLKYINDTLGHAQGDRAICSISDELIDTFKDIGIAGRLGGDEFLVFIPKYHRDDIDPMMTELLRKLTALTIGENNEQNIHCSIGISLADDDVHDFASLYKRADTALYHVKNNGKNDYAYFEKGMFDSEYRYKPFELAASGKSALFENLEFRRIMNAFAIFYPEIIMFNITKNTSCVLASHDDFIDVLPHEGNLDNLMNVVGSLIHPEFRAQTLPIISREGLLSAYKQGENAVFNHCRLVDSANGEQHWVAFLIIFYKNGDGDVCTLNLIRKATEHTIYHDSSRVRLALELAAEADVEFACSIFPANGAYNVICGTPADIPEKGCFSCNLETLCGMTLEEISEKIKNGEHFKHSFKKGEKQAYFALADPYNGEITMLVTKSK